MTQQSFFKENPQLDQEGLTAWVLQSAANEMPLSEFTRYTTGEGYASLKQINRKLNELEAEGYLKPIKNASRIELTACAKELLTVKENLNCAIESFEHGQCLV